MEVVQYALWRCSIIRLFLQLLFPTFSIAQQLNPLGPLYSTCMRNTTTSLTATFARNLNTTLRNFTNLASQESSKYAIATAGSSGLDMVYAVFQCRGDLSPRSCGECVQNVTARLPQECPKSVGARIRVDGCFLRYDNQSFFSLDTTYVMSLCSTAKTSDAVMVSAIADVMKNVTGEAPRQEGWWATASTSLMYAAAQCLGYLNQSECAQCLSSSSYRAACDFSLGGQVYLASCAYRFEAYNFLQAPDAAISAPNLPASPPGGRVILPSPAGNKAPIIIALSVALGVIIVVGAACAILVWHYKASHIKGKAELLAIKAGMDKQVDRAAAPIFLQNKAWVFSVEELEEATGHFHPTNKLGEGGFGIVYKGTLSNGEQIAIKKLSIERQQGKQAFLNEINLMTSVQHKNLIRLLGCCVEGPKRLLVYEYLLNKSLDFFLSGARDNTLFNWSTRYGIVIGMAKGLAYLHEESHVRIIHRDIKPSNILLDDQLNPVIADFGLARLVKDNETHVNTGVAGTIGYLAPEYALRGALSEKVDVFSFGVVSLETVTGKQNIHSTLLTRVWEEYQHAKVLDLVDERLGSAFSPEQLIRVVHIALLCTQENPEKRPTMSMVTIWLSGTTDILEIPSRPTFLDYNDTAAPMGEINSR